MSNQPTFGPGSLSQGVTTTARLPPKEGASSLILWSVLLLLGGVCVAVAGHQQRSASVEAAQRVQAALYYQSQVQRFVSDTLAAGAGQGDAAGATQEIPQVRDRARQALSSLQQGGRIPALGLELSPLPASSVPAARTAQTSLTGFDQAASPILASTDTLSALGQAVAAFDASALDFSQQATRAQKAPRLSSGPWGTAVSQVVKDLTATNGPLTSTTLLGPSVTANDPRIALVRQRAADVVRLAQAAGSEASLSSGDRDALAAMARAANAMVSGMDAVLRQRIAAAPAVAAVVPAAAASSAVFDAADNLVEATRRVSDDGGQQWMWVGLVGWGLALLSLIMLLRQCWQAVERQYQLMLDGRLGQSVLHANDRLSNRLRRILSLETRDDHLKEAPESPNFALASIINKVLDQRLSAANLMEEQGQLLTRINHESEALITQMIATQNETDRIVASSHINTGHFSALVMDASESLDALRQDMAMALDQVSRLSGQTQGALWKLDAVRETTQDASKRIKRLGESAQSVSSSSDSVRDIASQAKVLALNVAVEAAQRGEEGRIFSDVAKELESLARDLDTAVGEINFQSSTIQDDSRQTVEVMEQGVANIVECAKMAGDATAASKTLLNHVQELDQKRADISAGLGEAARGVLSEQESLANALAGVRAQSERLAALRDRSSAPKGVIQAFRTWLGQLGRDF